MPIPISRVDFLRRGLRYSAVIVLGIGLPAFAQNLVALSPDGKRAAYVSDNALWLLETDATSAPKRVASVSAGHIVVPRWAPRGERLAYYSKESGTLQLWIYDSQSRTNRQASFVEGGINPPLMASIDDVFTAALRYSWSPDGLRIAFSSQVAQGTAKDKARENTAPVFPSREALEGGQPVVLTRDTPSEWTLHGIFNFHGSGLTYDNLHGYNPETGPAEVKTTQLFVLDIESGNTSQLTRYAKGYFTPEWSPDGQRLAYMSANGDMPWNVRETNIFVLDLLTGEERKLTSGNTRKTLPRWSPDGSLIAYRSKDVTGTFVRKEEAVYVVPLDGSAPPRSISAGIDRRHIAYEWSPDGSAILVSYWDGLAMPLSRVDIHTKELRPVSPAKAVVGLDFGVSSGGVAWTQLTDPNGATTLWYWSASGQPQMLVQIKSAADLTRERRYETLHWENSRGETIDGQLLYPIGYDQRQKYPMLVDAYGLGIIGRSYENVNYVKASPKYFVLRPNHRAPHMWLNGLKGARYDAAAVGPSGVKVMTDDILSGVDAIARRGLIDAKRMCLVGFSNGGLQAEQLLTRTNRFKCAVIQSPSMSDWFTPIFLLRPDGDAIRTMYGIAPWEDPSIYTALIPLFHADKINTPILLATGDRELAAIPTIEMYNALRLLKKDVTFLRYTTEGHGFTGAAEQDFTRRIGEFFATHLEN